MESSKPSFSFVVGCLIFLVIGCCCISVDAAPNGAPEAACSTMTPDHGVGWQNVTCPFEIIVEKTTLYAGESLKIQLGIKSFVEVNDPAARGFKGFMIMAFDATGQNIEPIGIFDGMASNNEIKTMDCPSPSRGPNSKTPKVGATHTNNGFKKSVEVVWTPPADLLGPIIISATFVHEKEMLWVKETSDFVQIIPDPGPTTPTVPTTTTEPTTTSSTTTEATTTTTMATRKPTTTTTEATTTTTTTMATRKPTTTIASTTTEATTTTITTTTTTEPATTTTTTPKPTTQGAASSVAEWTVLLGFVILSFIA